MDLQLVYATFPDRETAQDLAKAMVERQLAACVTFWEAGSIYRWEGEIEETTETLALFKTRADLVPDLEDALAEAHPYDVPCLLPLDVDHPHQAYALWVEAETSQS